MDRSSQKRSTAGFELGLHETAKSWTACKFSDDKILGSIQRAEQRE